MRWNASMATLMYTSQLIKFLSKNWQSRSGKELDVLKGIHKKPTGSFKPSDKYSKLFSLGHESTKQAFLHLGL